MTRRRVVVLFSILAALAVAGVTARSLAEAHVRSRGGDDESRDLACTRCHGSMATWRPSLGTGRMRYPDPVGLALTPGEDRLLVTCEGTDALAVVDVATLAVLHTISFEAGSSPHGVAPAPDGRTAYVGLRGRDRVAAVDLSTGEVRESEPLVRSPAGLALDRTGRVLVVAGAVSEDIALVDTASLRIRVRLAGGREPWAVAISPDGRWAHVVSRLSSVHGPQEAPEAEVTVIDLPAERVVARVTLPSCHMSEGIAFLPDGSRSLVPVIRVRNRMPIVQVDRGWVMSSGLAVVPADGRGPVSFLPLDSMDRCEADPAGIATVPGGAEALVVSGGADLLTVVDLPALMREADEGRGGDGRGVDRLDRSAEYVSGSVALGAHPREVVVSSDGGRAFVTERWSGSVAVIDLATRRVEARVELDEQGEPSAVRRGDRVFHAASVTFQGQFSCRSCHPDGHQDGLAYDFEPDGCGRNVVDNRSLLGIRGTEPFKWIGLNPDARAQCGPRFAKVLTRADPFPEERLDDLVAYLESLPASHLGYGPRAGPLSESARRGQALFLRKSTGDGTRIPVSDRCVTCHPPPTYTSRRLADVGTRGPGDDHSAFDVPHLRGSGTTAPYLHDGRATTLEEIWTVHDPDRRHGRVGDLTRQELNDLVEFLRGL